MVFPLVNYQFAIENCHLVRWFTHSTWWFVRPDSWEYHPKSIYRLCQISIPIHTNTYIPLYVYLYIYTHNIQDYIKTIIHIYIYTFTYIHNIHSIHDIPQKKPGPVAFRQAILTQGVLLMNAACTIRPAEGQRAGEVVQVWRGVALVRALLIGVRRALKNRDLHRENHGFYW
jgi:hypothetical protein